ncbi:hypothetical protein ACA593_18305, partial [Lactiplantibacillus pentosus]
HSWGMPPVMFSVITKYHKGRHSLFLYNSEIFYAFTQDILRSQIGLVTLYRGYNYGTSLQAYALKTYLEQLGYETDIIWKREGAHSGRDIRFEKLFRMFKQSILRPNLLKETVKA